MGGEVMPYESQIFARDPRQGDDQEVQYELPDGTPAPTGYYPHNRWGSGLVPLRRPDVVPGTVNPDREYIQDETVDQHPYVHVSATWLPGQQQGRRDGLNDPLVSGLPQPDMRLMDSHYRRLQGSSISRFADVPGHTFPPYGSQSGAPNDYTHWQLPGAVMASYQDSIDPNAPAPKDPCQPPAQKETVYKLPPSPAHGWTSRPMMNVRATENAKAVALVQQQATPQNRLAPNIYAGQSYGAGTARVANPPGVRPTHTRRPRG